MNKTKIILIVFFGAIAFFAAGGFSIAKTKIWYKTFKFYGYVVKYPAEPIIVVPLSDNDYWQKWKTFISRKGKVLFTLDAPDWVEWVKSVNVDGKGQKELVIYGRTTGSGCFFYWFVFSIKRGKLKKTFEIRDECVPDFKSFLKKYKHDKRRISQRASKAHF